MWNARAARRSAFSAVELAAVCAPIVLLAALVVPALNHTRQQARIAVCQSNLGLIAQAANAYLVEYHDLPWAMPGSYTEAGGDSFTADFISEFVWGGGLPDKTSVDWAVSGMANSIGIPAGQAVRMDTYRYPPRIRPLNRFIAADVHWDNRPGRRVTQPKPLPMLFKCPEDRTAGLPVVAALEPLPVHRKTNAAWDWFGTSYATNWYWPYYYVYADSVGFQAALGVSSSTPGYGRRMLKDKHGRATAELAIFYENQMNYALAGARPPGYGASGPGPWHQQPKQLIGWHGELNYHTAAFRDGSARYRYYDTRVLMGCNWTLWPSRPWDSPWDQYNDEDPPCP